MKKGSAPTSSAPPPRWVIVANAVSISRVLSLPWTHRAEIVADDDAQQEGQTPGPRVVHSLVACGLTSRSSPVGLPIRPRATPQGPRMITSSASAKAAMAAQRAPRRRSVTLPRAVRGGINFFYLHNGQLHAMFLHTV